MSLYKKLEEYRKSDYIPMHMPGHKRNYERFHLEQAAGIDITEIDGFDDYHCPEGIIREIEEQAGAVYHTKKSYYLVNGSTAGLLAAISAVAKEKDPIIIARNCHRAVYHAVYVNGLVPSYIYPGTDSCNMLCGIDPEDVKEALDETGCQAAAVVITSPTYEGVVSDIRAIADVCHKKGAVLIVDEAHGAHFNYNAAFPKTAMECGADIVIESLHKTLPCYTQTAILHLCSDRVLEHRLQRYLSIYQTSSPSYLFMAGINRCIDYMTSEEGKRWNETYIRALKDFRKRLGRFKNVKLWEPAKTMAYDYDRTKIVLYCRGCGMELYKKLLKDYHIQPEMGAADYVIAMTSIGDDFSWYEKFEGAMDAFDKAFKMPWLGQDQHRNKNIRARVIKSPKEAMEKEEEAVWYPLKEAVGRVTLEWVYAYPPGIPLMYPGELVSEELIDELLYMREHGVTLKGFRDFGGEKILCIE